MLLRRTIFSKWVPLCCICLLAHSNPVPAQLKPGLPEYSRLNFKQELNIFQWSYSLNFHKLLGENLTVNAKADLNTSLQQISSRDLWKDSEASSVHLSYELAPALSLGPSFQSYILSDQFVSDNDVTVHGGFLEADFRPLPQLRLNSKIGSKWQTQANTSDNGFSYGLDSELSDFYVGDYENNLSLSAEQDIFPQRQNHDLQLLYQIERQFYQSTADTLTFVFERRRRDSFDTDSTGLFVRNLVQTHRGIRNRLSYRIGERSTLFLKNSFVSTTFSVEHDRENADTEIRKDDAGFISEHSAVMLFREQSWFSEVAWTHRFRSREDRRPDDQPVDPFGRHPTVGFDTEDALGGLKLKSGWRFSTRDSVGLSASALRFRYDTSDSTNPNDHDQIKWQITLAYRHHFSPSLKLLWRASTFLNHFVFISSKFSNGNNWERTFQLYPEIVYKPSPGLRITQGFIVRARYQTFDFDDPIVSNRNIVNRHFVMLHRSALQMTRQDRLELSYNMEVAEQGRLFFDQWRQTLALSWRNHEARLTYRHDFVPGFSAAPGIKFFYQKRYDHRSATGGDFIRMVRDSHVSYGPVLQVLYQPDPNLQFIFSGDMQFVDSSRGNSDRINLFDVYLNWFF